MLIVASLRALALSFLVVCLLPQAARAQSAQDLVAKNLEARGGAEKLAAISSIQFTGKVTEPGDFELTYQETRRRKDGAALYHQSIEGLTLVQAYDGKIGWRINPFEGRKDAERMSVDDTRALADDATIDGPLLTAKTHGSTITYLGREDFEGTNTYKLRLVDASGAEYAYYLDPDTYLEIKVVETRELRGAKQITLLELGDYEQVDGVYFPFDIESGAPDSTSADRQKLVIDHAQANIPVPDTLFALPVSAGAK
jgi:hypothetical protein